MSQCPFILKWLLNAEENLWVGKTWCPSSGALNSFNKTPTADDIQLAIRLKLAASPIFCCPDANTEPAAVPYLSSLSQAKSLLQTVDESSHDFTAFAYPPKPSQKQIGKADRQRGFRLSCYTILDKNPDGSEYIGQLRPDIRYVFPTVYPLSFHSRCMILIWA